MHLGVRVRVKARVMLRVRVRVMVRVRVRAKVRVKKLQWFEQDEAARSAGIPGLGLQPESGLGSGYGQGPG